MEIRNVMEERVLSLVHEIAEEEEARGSGRYCTSPQCRLDAACYVLNRIPQRYVTSGRGFAYLQADLQDNVQLHIDMVTLVHEGFQRVSSIQRSFYDENSSDVTMELQGDFYWFMPTIRGRFFNGVNFEPLVDAEVFLRSGKELVPMIDSRWNNPYHMVINTPGTYLFWPKPILAPSAGVEQIFELVLEIDDPRFEPFKHYIQIPAQSEALRSPRSLIRDFTVSDLFLLPRSMGPEMDWSVVDEDIVV